MLVTFFGAGLSPIAPGTVGSLATVLCVVGVQLFHGHASYWVPAGLGLVAAIVNVALGKWIERYFGRKDPGAVVVDEVAGQSIVLCFAVASPAPWWSAALVAFGLFRVFDIAKPLGVRRLEKLPHGWGVLMDDILAGVYAGLVFWLVQRWL